ncbi:LexA/Signal peptidase, partial [Paraphaeosphaeria sporulosa]
CAAVFFRDHFYTIDSVNGSSMAPTLSPLAHETGAKDRIFIKRGFDRRDIQRGDVITFWKPHKQSEISIKRVVGVEGDTVYPHRGYACNPEVVNGRRVEGWDGLGSREWALGGDGEVELGKVVVPNGHVWVEGDNWRRSYDSCDFGPVSLGLVDGKARWVWRDWLRLQPVGDEREKGRSKSMVVAGKGRVERRF